jgi:hypothetical protein
MQIKQVWDEHRQNIGYQEENEQKIARKLLEIDNLQSFSVIPDSWQ